MNHFLVAEELQNKLTEAQPCYFTSIRAVTVNMLAVTTDSNSTISVVVFFWPPGECKCIPLLLALFWSSTTPEKTTEMFQFLH